MQKAFTPMSSSSMPDTQLAVEQGDTNMMMNSSNVDNADMTDSNYKHALKIAKADAMETAATLENLIQGIHAVKRILEHPIDMEKYDKSTCVGESSDVKIISNLSNKLVGVLGSELLGLLNAAQMAKGHAKLRVEDDQKVIEELHRAKEFAHELNYKLDRTESINLLLKEEKKLLVKEIRTLRGDQRLLVKEVKSLRKMAHRTKQFDNWRLLEDHLRDATMVHESVLSNKTFNSRFAGIDPPGMKVTKDTDMQERKSKDHEDDFNRAPLVSNKENNAQNVYFPRKHGCKADKFDRVLKYTKCKPSKQRGLSFPTGISNSLTSGLGRFKNVLQEASDQIRDQQSPHKENNQASATKHCQDQTQQLLSSRDNQKKLEESIVERSLTLTTNDDDYKPLDDEATKSTKSCSFEIDATSNSGEINSSFISCSDGEMPNDLALQISIDEDSSFFNKDCTDRLGDASSPPPHFMITPESLSSSEGQFTKVISKPMCNPNVLRTLSIPNGNTRGDTVERCPALKPRLRSYYVGP